MMKKRWKKIASKIDFERPHLKLIKEKFILPNGEIEDFCKFFHNFFIIYPSRSLYPSFR